MIHKFATCLRLAKNHAIHGGYYREAVECAIENAAEQLATEFGFDAGKLKDLIFERD